MRCNAQVVKRAYQKNFKTPLPRLTYYCESLPYAQLAHKIDTESTKRSGSVE